VKLVLQRGLTEVKNLSEINQRLKHLHKVDARDELEQMFQAYHNFSNKLLYNQTYRKLKYEETMPKQGSIDQERKSV
jgi:hypothetical protein